ASGPDGLEDIRQIVDLAPTHLLPGGWLLLEHGWDQGADVAALLSPPAWAPAQHRQDLAGHTRCTGAQAHPTA
ncbi:MAG: peptide chain release factor N(5)-glutamine methyltransferase, partial [Pseudomonadota bacterium]